MKVVSIPLEKIKPYQKNPRKNDDAVHHVAASIKQYGFQQPIVVDKKGVIIVGHTRYRAAQELELEKVPVIYADDLTPKQARAYRIADNKTHEYAAWDWDLLTEELTGLGKLDNIYTGFDSATLNNLLGGGEAYFPVGSTGEGEGGQGPKKSDEGYVEFSMVMEEGLRDQFITLLGRVMKDYALNTRQEAIQVLVENYG